MGRWVTARSASRKSIGSARRVSAWASSSAGGRGGGPPPPRVHMLPLSLADPLARGLRLGEQLRRREGRGPALLERAHVAVVAGERHPAVSRTRAHLLEELERPRGHLGPGERGAVRRQRRAQRRGGGAVVQEAVG